MAAGRVPVTTGDGRPGEIGLGPGDWKKASGAGSHMVRQRCLWVRKSR